MLPPTPPLDVILGVVAYWLTLGLIGLTRPADLRFVSRVLFPLSALGALVLTVAGVAAIPRSRTASFSRSAFLTCRFTCASTRSRPLS